MSQQQQHLTDLANVSRELYRSQVRASIAADTAIPFVVPLHFFTYYVVPTVYLAIPHRNRPWVYRARWLVLAFVVGLNWYFARNTVSLNFASGYGSGLLAAWSTIWNFTLLVWTRPQWDAKRVERRRKTRHVKDASVSSGSSGHTYKLESNGFAAGAETIGFKRHDEKSMLNGVRRREVGLHSHRSIESDILVEGTKMTAVDKYLMREILAINKRDGNLPLDQKTLLRLCKLTREQEYEYYWQEFPANASLRTRLNWSFDIVSSVRFTGWNWAPSCLPPFKPPPKIGDYQLPLEYGVHRSKHGFDRTSSRWYLIFSRWLYFTVPSYVVVDLCAVLMTMDPYFIVGPEQNYPLPAHLSSLHPALLFVQRALLSFAGILSALHLYWNTGALLLAICCPPLLGFRAHPWLMPSMTGSFTYVLDHGFAGFWGTWWHQTFRAGFAAPGKWLFRKGYLTWSGNVKNEKKLMNGRWNGNKNGNANGNGNGSSGSESQNQNPSEVSIALGHLVAAGIAFAQSGFIHGAGSYGTPWSSKPGNPLLFFALAYLGTITQVMLSRLLNHLAGKYKYKCPRFVRRSANFAFTSVWLTATSWLLVDDLSRCGVWLFEPVPVSLFRAAGFGHDRRVWRWDSESLPSWHWGPKGRWWETGLAI